MNRFIAFLLPFILAASIPLAAFANGTGLSMLAGPGKKTPQELADMIAKSVAKDPDGKGQLPGVCTTPNDFLQAIRAYHPEAGIESYPQLEAYLRTLIPKPGPTGQYKMSRMLAKSYGCVLDTKTGWTRAFAPGELAWVDPTTQQPILAEDCGNVVAPHAPVQAPPPQVEASVLPPVTGTCPTTNFLKVNIWPKEVLTMTEDDPDHPGQKKLVFQGLRQAINAEEETTRFRGHPSVSADYGGKFRDAMKQGRLFRDDKKREFDIFYIMTPEAHGKADPSITEQRHARRVTIEGLGELSIPKAETDRWDAIRIVPVSGADPVASNDIVYTPLFEGTGKHELRFFNHLDGTQHGEWDNNPVPDCIMNVHFIVDDHDVLIPLD